MICTVTFNPSLDYIVRVDDMRLGVINRTTYEQVLPGGKGINVSIVLGNLGHASRALGFLAGFTGAEIARRVSEAGVSADFIEVAEGMSRINAKIKSNEETELNGQGPLITEENIEELYAKLDVLGEGDTLVISGSVPNTLPGDMYERIMARLEGRGVRIVVDAERDLLTRVLPYKPFLVKPNNIELGDIYGVTLETRDEVVPYAKRMQEAGAQNVLVSMAGEGGVLVSADGQVFQSPAAKGTVVNSVGAGDSSVAGFLAGLIETGSYETAFRMALASGSASAFSDHLATRPEVEALMAGSR
ncbi:MAG: 1-phosphofructokinase [Parolsenella sp.]|uniref:1-phosphofructokinase n=1 Tax=Parolsenella sp. TaxID=2083006 RepID=UPI002A762660|nr:1-phosphofructokinase [Parolsenella sp.]MDY3292458.1 1-phosphofructokinase [Parolsenella sp.]